MPKQLFGFGDRLATRNPEQDKTIEIPEIPESPGIRGFDRDLQKSGDLIRICTFFFLRNVFRRRFAFLRNVQKFSLVPQPVGCLSHSVRPRRAAFADCQTTPTTPTHTYAAAAADDAASCQTTPTTPTLPDDSTTPTTPTHTFDSDHAAAAFTDAARRLRLLRRTVCKPPPTLLDNSDHAAAASADAARRLRLLRRCQTTPTTPTHTYAGHSTRCQTTPTTPPTLPDDSDNSDAHVCRPPHTLPDDSDHAAAASADAARRLRLLRRIRMQAPPLTLPDDSDAHVCKPPLTLPDDSDHPAAAADDAARRLLLLRPRASYAFFTDGGGFYFYFATVIKSSQRNQYHLFG